MTEETLLEKLSNLADRLSNLTTTVQGWIDKHEKSHEKIEHELHSLDKRGSIYTLISAIGVGLLVWIIRDLIK